MATDIPNAHRLSPSGLFLGTQLATGSVLRNVYKGFFPRGTENALSLVDLTASHTVETFAIDLPAVFPNTDPPETFDPNKLLYLIWVNTWGTTEVQGATPGTFQINTRINIDSTDSASLAPGMVQIQNQVNDTLAWAAQDHGVAQSAGDFPNKSRVHQIPDEGVVRVDILEETNLAVFRPGTIPLWFNSLTGYIGQVPVPWAVGTTRHIYVEINAAALAPNNVTVYMPNFRSNIVIAEFYGDVVETIGMSGIATGGTAI